MLVKEAHYLECMVPAQGWLYNEKALAYAWGSLYPINEGLDCIGNDRYWHMLTEQDELSCITPVLIFPDEGSFDGLPLWLSKYFVKIR